MQLRKGAWILVLMTPFYLQAIATEGGLNFYGLVTEATCALGSDKGATMLSADAVGRSSLFTITLEKCSQETLGRTKLLLKGVVSDTDPPKLKFLSGEKIQQGDYVDIVRFNKGVTGEPTLSLLVSRPVGGIPASYGALFYLTYD